MAKGHRSQIKRERKPKHSIHPGAFGTAHGGESGASQRRQP